MAPSSHKPTTRAMVLAYARDWCGTPYVHQACKKGVGCDCLGLLRGVWQDIYGEEAERPPAYTPYWAELKKNSNGNEEPMLDAAFRHLIPVKLVDSKPGDVLLIRVRKQSAVKHCGIIAPKGRIIHAYDRHEVVEHDMHVNWKKRDQFVFAFPGVTD